MQPPAYMGSAIGWDDPGTAGPVRAPYKPPNELGTLGTAPEGAHCVAMVPTRFAVAAHILLMIAADGAEPSTSQRLAASINTNPVVIRRITGLLARAGLVRVRRGPGGAELMRPAATITLRDVWRAVQSDADRPLLPLHANPDPACPVGCRVHAVLGAAFGTAEQALEAALARTTLADLLHGVTDQAA